MHHGRGFLNEFLTILKCFNATTKKHEKIQNEWEKLMPKGLNNPREA